MEQISQGAEAKIYLEEDNIIKDRFAKTYRHPIIDDKLRKARTRREAKVLQKLAEIDFSAPRLIECDNKQIIKMEHIKGDKLRDVLERLNKWELISRDIGKKLAMLHNNGIIHGDLTTSNMILGKKIISTPIMDKEIYFIDFGLSFFSDKVEDKAVDLHLLRQALESKHYQMWAAVFGEALRTYLKTVDQSAEIHERFKLVEERGRNKGKD